MSKHCKKMCLCLQSYFFPGLVALAIDFFENGKISNNMNFFNWIVGRRFIDFCFFLKKGANLFIVQKTSEEE